MAVLTLEPALPGERGGSRRGSLGICLGLLLILMIGSSGLLAHRNRDTVIPLDAVAVAVGPGGQVIKVAAANELVPGSRVLAGTPESSDLASEQADWLASGTVPQASGLGLAITYSIIKKHGGLLHLERSSPEGAAFAFYLPAARAPATANGAGQDSEPSSPLSHQRVLVMDDEPAIRELTTQLLATLGYEVTAVPDGLEAIRAYERALRRGEQFKAVILDATVRGGLGGLATIERLRGMDPHVNAIICSGYSDEAALSQFLAYGFRGALPKPFTRGELSEAIQKSLETRKRE